MRKLRLYLDTSVISHLDAMDVPDKMDDTLRLWQDIQEGKYIACLSDITLGEINRCPEPKRTAMLTMLGELDFEELSHSDEADGLAASYFEAGGLPPKSRADAQHIAIASVTNCNAIVSWNFKHIVNLRAMTAVESVNLKMGYRLIRILSPTMLLDKED